MKVKELIKHLQELENDNLEIYAGSDSEGNSYAKLDYLPTIFYREKSADGEYLDSDSVMGVDDFDEGESKKDYKKIVIL